MITMRQVGDYMLAEPFRPFRIEMAGGESFEISDPEMISVGRTSARVLVPAEPNSGDMDRRYDVPFLQIKSLEPIDVCRF